MKKISINLIVSFLSQAVVIVLGLIVPRVVLVNYGSDTNGLTSTITQVFAYMALLEAGISQATSNALYGPIAKKDTYGVNAIISLSKKTFRKTTIYYGLIVVALSFVLPLVLKTEVNYWTIFLIVLFEGMTNVVSFFFLNTWNCFLNADGKSYIVNIIATLGRIICYGAKIALAIMKVNIGLIQVVFFAVSLIKIPIYYLIFKKHYNWMAKVPVKGLRLKDKNSFLINEIASTIFSSTDMIVLAIFVSASLSSVYSVYSMVFLSLAALLNSVYSSVSYKLGIAYQKGTDYYQRIHNIFNVCFMSAITILMSTAYILIMPFVKLYTQGVDDIDYYFRWAPLLFGLIQMLSWSRYVSGNLTGIAGFAKKVSVASIIEALVNLTLSIILVQFYGLYGVLIATVVAIPIKVIYCLYLSDFVIIKGNFFFSLKILISNYLLFGLSVFIGELIDFTIGSYSILALHGLVLVIICALIIIPINFLLNYKLLLKKD